MVNGTKKFANHFETLFFIPSIDFYCFCPRRIPSQIVIQLVMEGWRWVSTTIYHLPSTIYQRPSIALQSQRIMEGLFSSLSKRSTFHWSSFNANKVFSALRSIIPLKLIEWNRECGFQIRATHLNTHKETFPMLSLSFFFLFFFVENSVDMQAHFNRTSTYTYNFIQQAIEKQLIGLPPWHYRNPSPIASIKWSAGGAYKWKGWIYLAIMHRWFNATFYHDHVCAYNSTPRP